MLSPPGQSGLKAKSFGLSLGLKVLVSASPRPDSPGLGLVALASASASRFWPRLTSLIGAHVTKDK